jgi:hypothetical protein
MNTTSEKESQKAGNLAFGIESDEETKDGTCNRSRVSEGWRGEVYGTQGLLFRQKAGNRAFWLSRLPEIWLSV